MYRNVHMPVVVQLMVEEDQWVDYGTVFLLKCSHALVVLNALELRWRGSVVQVVAWYICVECKTSTVVCTLYMYIHVP